MSRPPPEPGDDRGEAAAELGERSFSGRRHFFLYWTAVCLCSLGVHLTGYSLGIWSYEVTGSVTVYTLFPLLVILPVILFSPFAGALVDRMENRRVMLFAFLLAAAFLVPVYSLTLRSEPYLGFFYGGVFVLSLTNAVLYPALSALATRILDRKFLGKASALLQMSIMLPGLLAPVLAGMLLSFLDISTVVLLALVAQAVPVFLAIYLFRSPRSEESAPKASPQSFSQDLREGFLYLKAHRGLRYLVGLMFLTHVSTSMLQASAIPFFLEVTTKRGMSAMLTAVILGMVAGSLLLVVHEGPRRRARVLMTAGVLGGLQICVAATFQNAVWMSIFCGSGYFCHALANSLDQAIWQVKVDPQVLGRVVSIRRVILLSGFPISYLVVGPLVERLLMPFKSQIAVYSLGLFSAEGKVGVFGFLWFLLGAGIVVTHLIGLRIPHLRGLDQDEGLT